ncbi:MAG: uroporphyrinogen decarboxylase family protein [Candidatus Helarchaeota archaeon]
MESMSSLERVLATATGKIPDRVPIFPLTTSKGAFVLDIPLPELYKSGENIFKGQKKFQELIGHDYVTSFFYLVKDAEPWGAEPIYFNDGDPNLKNIPFQELKDILNVETPSPNDSPAYNEPKKAIKLFANSDLKGKVPIIGVQTGPFSLPTLFFGTTKWLETLLIDPNLFSKIVDKIVPYSIEWANLQIELGVDIILIVDGIVSTTILPPDVFTEYVVPIYKKLTSSIKAPVVLGGAGGEFQPVLEKIIETGVIGVTLSSNDDLEESVNIVGDKLTLIGNLNNLEFIDWPPEVIEENVKSSINAGTKNFTRPGYILMNQHSFPRSVKMEQIELMVKYGKKYGVYK